MKLLLFDIDGTLLLTHGIGRRSVDAAISTVLGRRLAFDGIAFSGKTDPQIFREILDHHGISPAQLNGQFDHMLAIYQEQMQVAIREHGVEVLPGVPELIERLHDTPDVQLALLTGNLEPMAYLKLEAAGLADYFPFGAFGSDNPDRHQLPAIAVERARAHLGRDFAGQDIVIIGDTEHDIACGRGVGAFSVAVCTGHFTRDDLHAHDPHILLDDLTDIDGFLRIVGAGAA